MRLRLILAVTALVLLAMPASAAAENPKTWRVTIDNLTGPPFAAFGQPLSAPLVAVHSNQADMWSVGEPASETIRYIAEDGHPEFGLAALTGQPGYKSVAIHFLGALPPPFPPGIFPIPIFPPVPGAPLPSTRTFQVQSEGKYNRLSIAMMLGITNDAFTGIDSLPLHSGVFYTSTYDAGTERNNEAAPYLAFFGNLFVRDLENGVITHHPGLQGVASLNPAVYGWRDPVARITITRLK